jgi:Zn-dependent alcohol dehydrogenase
MDYPIVLGHEGAGIIRAIGANVQDSSLTIGSRVILTFNHCGSCLNCTSRHPACCENFETLNITGTRLDKTLPATLADGRPVVSQFFGQSSFLRHSVVSQHSVVLNPYPDDLALYAALGCGFQTGAGTVLNALKPSPNDSILIFGAGTVGLAAIMGAKYLNVAQIIVVDVVKEKLELAKELGATHAVNSSGIADIAAEVRKLTAGGSGVRFAVDCTGVSAVLDSLLDCVCCGGTAGIVGSPKPDFVLKIDPEKMLHENKTLRGTCQGDSVPKKVSRSLLWKVIVATDGFEQFIVEMMELHRSGNFPLEKLITFYDIVDFEKAISDVKNGKVGRLLAHSEISCSHLSDNQARSQMDGVVT